MDFNQSNIEKFPKHSQDLTGEDKPAEKVSVHNLVNMDSAHFAEAVNSDFGMEIANIEENVKGRQSQVYRATTPDGKVVFIRINKSKEVFEVEVLGYKMFEEMDIPVPGIISYKENPQAIGHPTMVMHAAEGTSLKEAKLSDAEETSIYENVGQVLRKINEVKLEGFGPLEIVDGKFKGKFASNKEYCDWWWKSSLSSAIGFLSSNGLITHEEETKLLRIFKEVSSMDFGKSSLLYRDMHSEHIFVKDGKISGFIDLGRLGAGDPRYDVAQSLLFQNERQQEHFKKGYGEVADDEVVKKYLALRAAGKLFTRIKRNGKEPAEKVLQLFRKTLSEL